MCVICIIPKGVELPTRDELTAMYRCNPDGMGFCTPTVQYRGLSFSKFLNKLRKRDINEPCIMHFRLATHGSVKPSNCHPFYDGSTGTYFAHNGILSVTPKGDMTDSEFAFKRILVPCIKRNGIHSPEFAFIVSAIIGYSKFAFMQGENVCLHGSFIERNGRMYSNLRFLPFVASHSHQYMTNWVMR